MKSTATLIGALPLACAIAASSSHIGKSYRIYHMLGNESTMTSRGTIQIAPTEEDSIGLVATFHPDSSAQLDTASFDAMVESGAFYTVVVSEVGGGGLGEKTSSVSASVPGCSVRRSNLREEIGLSIGPTGKLLGVSYRPVISPLAPKTCQQIKPLSEKPEAIFGRNGEAVTSMPFKTTVYFDSHKPMMAIPAVLSQTYRPPPGLKWYRRNTKNNPSAPGGSDVKREGGGGIPRIPGVDDNDEHPPGSFKSTWLYKYWHFLLPMAIVMMLGGVGEEEVRVGQAAAGGVTAVATGGAAAGSAKQRRGKRD